MSKRKKLLDLCYICPRGTREGMPYFFVEKSVFVKHTNDHDDGDEEEEDEDDDHPGAVVLALPPVVWPAHNHRVRLHAPKPRCLHGQSES